MEGCSAVGSIQHPSLLAPSPMHAMHAIHYPKSGVAKGGEEEECRTGQGAVGVQYRVTR